MERSGFPHQRFADYAAAGPAQLRLGSDRSGFYNAARLGKASAFHPQQADRAQQKQDAVATKDGKVAQPGTVTVEIVGQRVAGTGAPTPARLEVPRPFGASFANFGYNHIVSDYKVGEPVTPS